MRRVRFLPHLTAIKAASSKALAKETEESLKAKVFDILIKRLQARYLMLIIVFIFILVGHVVIVCFLVKDFIYSHYKN